MSAFRIRLAIISLAALASACGDVTAIPGGGSPSVTVLATGVAAGTAVPLRLQNPTATSLGYQTCPGSFERLEGGVWVEVPTALMGCLAVITSIAPGETVNTTAFLVSEAPAGTYRAVVPFSTGSEQVVRVSNSFTVEPLPLGGAPTVSVLQAGAARGTEVTVRLLNPTTLDFLHNLCSAARLERQVGGQWVPTADPLWICTAALSPLDAGAFVDESYPIAGDLVPGTYRLQVQLYRPAADAVTRYSNAFAVN